MPVNLQAPRAEDLLAIDGVRIGVVEAGVRKANRKDLTVFTRSNHISSVIQSTIHCISRN